MLLSHSNVILLLLAKGSCKQNDTGSWKMTHMPTLIFLDNDSIAFQYKMEPDITNGRKQPFVADLKARQRINSSRNC